jgi:predicted nucleic acid-binding protein
LKTAVDSSVLLDVLGADPTFGERSRAALKKAYTAGAIVACDIVWAEVSASFPEGEDPSKVLALLGLQFDAVSAEAAHLAGTHWRRYRSRGGPRKERIVPDFLVGAHALLQADILLTRDRGFYRAHFSAMRLHDPSAG